MMDELAPALSPEPLETMLRLLNGQCVEQSIHVAAVLGIADLLREGAKSSDELARATGADPSSMYRLLRTLASIEVFGEDEGGYLALMPLGNTLRSDVPDSVWDRATFYGAPEMWEVWGNLLHSVRTGESACEHVHDAPFYDFLTATCSDPCRLARMGT